MKINARPCPFCKSARIELKENILEHDRTQSRSVPCVKLYCKTCKAEGPKVEIPQERDSIMPYIEEAVSLWNTRSTR